MNKWEQIIIWGVIAIVIVEMIHMRLDANSDFQSLQTEIEYLKSLTKDLIEGIRISQKASQVY